MRILEEKDRKAIYREWRMAQGGTNFVDMYLKAQAEVTCDEIVDVIMATPAWTLKEREFKESALERIYSLKKRGL